MNKQEGTRQTQAGCVLPALTARWLAMAIVTLGLSACSLLPAQPEAAEPAAVAPVATRPAHEADFKSSYTRFAQGQNNAALARLERVINDPQSSVMTRRHAFLAKALIRLNGNAAVRDMAAARAELRNAKALNATAEPDVLGLYFADAIEQALKATARAQHLQAQTEQISRDKAGLKARNDELAAQKAKLEVALEKLKKVALGTSD